MCLCVCMCVLVLYIIETLMPAILLIRHPYQAILDVLSAPIIISITVTFIFQHIFRSQVRSKYLSFVSFSLIFTLSNTRVGMTG